MVSRTLMHQNNCGTNGLNHPSDQSAVSDGYALSFKDLLPGDILIYCAKNPGSIAKGISAVTGSPYTHAGIFLEDGMVAESNFPAGVAKIHLAEFMAGARTVAVLRSQLGFGKDRIEKLSKFVSIVIENAKYYNAVAAARFYWESDKYFASQLEFIEKNYGKANTADEFSQKSFFCSAFVIACYSVVEIIDATAQVAYQPEHFSPGHLYKDPTFGWLAGYLVPEGGTIPADDPVFHETTHWADAADAKWW